MDEATVRGMLEQHFSSSDPDLAHEMYHDDAVLEFPQSGESFAGVENMREWRSNYVAEGWEPPEWRAQWRSAP